MHPFPEIFAAGRLLVLASQDASGSMFQRRLPGGQQRAAGVSCFG
jgi:hypothetical protein